MVDIERGPWSIYTLHDPIDSERIRYVGKTHRRPKVRLKYHLTDARKNLSNTHCSRWIRKLIADGRKPSMTIVETGTGNGWGEAEKRWIATYRARGMPLTNITDGGDDGGGWSPSEEERARRSIRMRELWANSRERMRAAIRDSHTPETRELKRLAALERQMDPAVQVKQHEAQKRNWADPSIRARRIDGITKAQANPALRAEQSERTKRMWADPEMRAERSAALKAGWARKHANGIVPPRA